MAKRGVPSIGVKDGMSDESVEIVQGVLAPALHPLPVRNVRPKELFVLSSDTIHVPKGRYKCWGIQDHAGVDVDDWNAGGVDCNGRGVPGA